MQNLGFIYNYNLSLINETDVRIQKDKDEEVDYSNKIKLIDLITKFNELYLLFKKDYKKLKKFNLSKRVEFTDFKENGNTKCLVLNLYGINKSSDYGTLYIRKSNNMIDSYITNDSSLFNEPKNIKLDSEVIDGYFKLLEKYKVLIDICELFKEFVSENNKGILKCNLNGNILDELDTFELQFITYETIGLNVIELGYRLGEQLYLLETIINIDGEMIGKRNELNKVSKHILENLYIERSKVLDDYEKKVKILKV